MSYEQHKNLKVSDIPVKDFTQYVIDQFNEDRDENDTTEYSADLFDTAVQQVLSHSVFGKQRVATAVRRGVRNVRSLAYEVRREDNLSDMIEVDGYYFGGEDWMPSKKQRAEGKTEPDKQSVSILTSDKGLWSLGMFGHSTNDDIDLIPYQKYRFTYQIYYADNGAEYPTIKNIELLEGSEEELAQWIANEEVFTPNDIVFEEDKYKPVFIRANIAYVDGKIMWVESETEKSQVIEHGKVVYDKETGKPLMKPKLVKGGIEPFIQSSTDSRKDDLFIGNLKLEADVSAEDKEARYYDVKFYNKRLGRHWMDIDVFDNEVSYEAICTLSPEECREFLNDEIKARTDEYLFVVIPQKYRSYTKDDDTFVENFEFKGQFVSDRLADLVEAFAGMPSEEKEQKKTLTKSEVETEETTQDINTEEDNSFYEDVIELTESELFQFMTNGQQTSFRRLEALGMFNNPEVIDHFGGRRITSEFEVPFNEILSVLEYFEGDSGE